MILLWIVIVVVPVVILVKTLVNLECFVIVMSGNWVVKMKVRLIKRIGAGHGIKNNKIGLYY